MLNVTVRVLHQRHRHPYPRIVVHEPDKTGDHVRPELDVDLVYRFIRDTTWVSVRWYQPGGPLTAQQVGQQYLAIVLGGITKEGV